MSDLRCDAYTATLQDVAHNDVLEWVIHSVPVHEQVLIGRDGALPRWRYDHAVGVSDGRTLVAVVRWGGNGDGVSVEFKGSVADSVYQSFRDMWPMHSCSRMDACLDRTRSGLFDLVHAACMAIASEARPRVLTEPKGLGWDQPGDYGRTKYFGSRKSSDLHLVLYEKGFERRDRGGLAESDVDLAHVRLEASAHPQKKHAKDALSRCTPLQVFGLSAWSRAMFEAFAGFEADPVRLPERVSDDDRTMAALLHSYGSFIDRKAAENGPAFFDELLSEVRNLRARRQGRVRA